MSAPLPAFWEGLKDIAKSKRKTLREFFVGDTLVLAQSLSDAEPEPVFLPTGSRKTGVLAI